MGIRLFSIWIFLCFFFSVTFAQNDASFFKVFPVQDGDLPVWAEMMYSDDPIIQDVVNAYEKYFNRVSFEKSIHTQNYKHWIQAVYPLIDEDGKIDKSRMFESRQTTTNKSNSLQWTRFGPFATYSNGGGNIITNQANVYDCAISKSNPNFMIAGVEGGGMYYTFDQGENWDLVPAGKEVSQYSISSVQIDPVDQNIFYFYTQGKLYKTTDQGISATSIFEVNGAEVVSIAIHPENSNILFIATKKGLYKSINQGIDWTLVTESTFSYDVEFKPENPDIVYTLLLDSEAQITRFYKSIDGGETFNVKDQGYYSSDDPNRNTHGGKIGISPSNPNTVYVALIGNAKSGDNGWIGVYKSNDSGESWTNPAGQDGGPYGAVNSNDVWSIASYGSGYHQGFYNFDFAVSTKDINKLWIGTIRLVESADGGATFTSIGGPNSIKLSTVHADIQRIYVQGDDILLATDGGLNFSQNEFQSAEPRCYGIDGSNFWGFGSAWNADVLVGGRYHNGNYAYHENYEKGNSMYLGGAESPTGYVDPLESRVVRFDDTSDKILSTSEVAGSTSIDNFKYYPNVSYFPNNSSTILYDADYRDHLYLGRNNVFYKSENNGETFDTLAYFENSRVLKAYQSKDDPNILYLIVRNYGNEWAQECELWKSIDRGYNWEEIDISIVANSNQLNFAIDQMDADKIFLLGSGNNNEKVFTSSDGGNNWINCSDDMISPHTATDAIAITTTNGVMLYYAVNNEIFRYNDSQSTWESVSEGLPSKFSVPLLQAFYKENKLRTAVRSFGIYETELPETLEIMVRPYTSNDIVNCLMDTVIFDSYSITDQEGASWEWSFTPEPFFVSNPTERNTLVVFGEKGYYSASLTLQKDGIEWTQSIDSIVYVDNKCSQDTDGDGIPDYLDHDADGDGLYNVVENKLSEASDFDTDGDGTINMLDFDSNQDGVDEIDALYDCSIQMPESTESIYTGDSTLIHDFGLEAVGVKLVSIVTYANCYQKENHIDIYVDFINKKIRSLSYTHFNSDAVEDDIVTINDTTIQSSSGSFAKTRFVLENEKLWYHLIEQPCGSFGHVQEFCILDGDDDNNGILNHLELVPESTSNKPIVTNTLKIYPNPVSDKCKVQFLDQVNHFKKIIIMDNNGKIQWSRDFENNANAIQYINTYELTSGAYTLFVFDTKGKKHYAKFIKI